MSKKRRSRTTFRIVTPSGIEVSIEDRGARGFFLSHTPPWGGRLRELITKGSRDEASRRAVELIEQHYARWRRGHTPTLVRVAAELIHAKKREGRAADYTRKIEEHLRLYILPHLGADTEVADITPRQLLAFKHALGASDLDPQTCNRILTSLRQILKYAEDPAGYIVSPALPRNFPTAQWSAREAWQLLGPPEIGALLGTAPSEIRAFLGYVANTGVRVGTALATELSWIDRDRRIVRYPASAMKGRSAHTVELNDMALAFLEEALEASPAKPFPFSYWFVLKRWVVLRKAVGRPTLRMHDLRHSFVSNQLAAGTPVHVVQQMAAHRSLAVTALYSHATDEARRAAAGRVQIGVAPSAEGAVVPPNVPPSGRSAIGRKRKSPLKQEAFGVPGGGIEPPTRGFSIPCSTN
jgi:integrase